MPATPTRNDSAPKTSSFATVRAAPNKRQTPALAPLRSRIFRALWLAGLASSIGTWMHDVGAAWLMTSLTKNEQMNALVSAAGTFPLFLLAMPAGALADIMDRRKLVILTQAWASGIAAILAILTLCNITGPWVLLGFTFLMALGGAMAGPAMQALLPDMVKKRHIAAAMSLGGISWNLSRIVGPLLGGMIIGVAANLLPNRATAPGVVFAINAVSFLAVVVVFARWRRPLPHIDAPPEHIIAAVQTGWRYTRHSRDLRAILVRISCLLFCGQIQFSLTPLYARVVLHLNATGFAIMLGCFGAAAVVGNLLFPRLSAKYTPGQLIFGASMLTSTCLLMLALAPTHVPLPAAIWLARLAMIVGGVAWPIGVQTCSVNLLRSVPDWVRSRATGMFTLALMGSATLASIIWGSVAAHSSLAGQPGSGIPTAYMAAALGLLVGALTLRGFVVVDPGNADLTPSLHWPEPDTSFEPVPESGPVLVMVECRVAAEDTEAFIAAMQRVRLIRLRDGALRWNLFEDTADAERWLETIMVESWNDYLRQAARITQVDREIEEAAYAYHRGEDPPQITHLIASSARPKPERSDDEDADET